MSTQRIIISLNNGKPVANPDPAEVDPGDTVIWALSSGLSWPPAFSAAAAIAYFNTPGSVVLINPNTVAWGVPIASGAPPTIRGQVRLTAVYPSFQTYIVNVVQVGAEDKILSTHIHDYHDIDSADPKLGVKPPQN